MKEAILCGYANDVPAKLIEVVRRSGDRCRPCLLRQRFGGRRHSFCVNVYGCLGLLFTDCRLCWRSLFAASLSALALCLTGGGLRVVFQNLSVLLFSRRPPVLISSLHVAPPSPAGSGLQLNLFGFSPRLRSRLYILPTPVCQCASRAIPFALPAGIKSARFSISANTEGRQRHPLPE